MAPVTTSAICDNIINITDWIEENKNSFNPPVMNKLMHGDGILKVMFVGGPNVRSDFHIEEGEEVFIQVKGRMVLRVQVDIGKIRDIEIKEGEAFLLPARMPHSPQRFPDTVGFVMERMRTEEERDGLRYYVEGDDNAVLWEKWFHLDNLVEDLPVVINEFKQSGQCKTGRPIEGFVRPPPFVLNNGMTFLEPFSVSQWMERNQEELGLQKCMNMFHAGMQTKVLMYGCGEVSNASDNLETFLWLWDGEATVVVDDEDPCCMSQPGDSLLITPKTGFHVSVGAGGHLMSIQMPINYKPY